MSELLQEKITPREKHRTNGKLVKYFYVVISFILSFLFATTLATIGLFYHLGQVISGEEKTKLVSEDKTDLYAPREPFPHLESMKPSSDLRYYALQLNLDLEEYQIITQDGYVLPLHRLVDPKESVLNRQRKKPILLQHGLLASSGAYLTSGRNSLSYYFLECGLDVWIGNNRSSFEVKHTHFNGNLMNSEKYWDWDVRDLAYYDLPCIIENVLSHKPIHDKLLLVGHSQGCTQSFLMLRNSALKEVHKKIDYFFPLAPAVFPGVSFHERGFIRFMHNKGRRGFRLMFGYCAFMRNLTQTRYYLYSTKIYAFFAYVLIKYLFGWSSKQWGPYKKIWHFHFIFIMSYVSAKSMSWWLSHWVSEGFSNQLQPKDVYRTGANFQNDANPSNSVPTNDDSQSLFPFEQEWFGSIETKVPMLIFDCELDFLVDTKRLVTHMRNFENSYEEGVNFDVIEVKNYNHVDITWAQDIIGTIGHPIKDKIDAQGSNSDQCEISEKSNSNT